jgi:hypothetical protein
MTFVLSALGATAPRTIPEYFMRATVQSTAFQEAMAFPRIAPMISVLDCPLAAGKSGEPPLSNVIGIGNRARFHDIVRLFSPLRINLYASTGAAPANNSMQHAINQHKRNRSTKRITTILFFSEHANITHSVYISAKVLTRVHPQMHPSTIQSEYRQKAGFVVFHREEDCSQPCSHRRMGSEKD